MAGKPGRSGPPKNNVNALTSGSKVQTRLIVGTLPKCMIAVEREAKAYRNSLTRELVEARGLESMAQITRTDGDRIMEATGWTLRAAVNRWILRNRFDKLSPDGIDRLTKGIADAFKARAEAVAKLQLDVTPDPWHVLYATPDPEPEQDDNG